MGRPRCAALQAHKRKHAASRPLLASGCTQKFQRLAHRFPRVLRPAALPTPLHTPGPPLPDGGIAMKEAPPTPRQTVEEIRSIVNAARTKAQTPQVGSTARWAALDVPWQSMLLLASLSWPDFHTGT